MGVGPLAWPHTHTQGTYSHAGRPTWVTPSMANSFLASGEAMASRALVKLLLPPSNTFCPGMNIRLAGLGVGCVWMNMPRRWAASGHAQVGNLQARGAAAAPRQSGARQSGGAAGMEWQNPRCCAYSPCCAAG